MREILFRAKREATNEWVYGYFVKEYDDFQIYVNSKIITKSGHEYVREDTLGQFTGLTDKNGTKIFEGDVVRISEDYYDGLHYSGNEVYYSDGAFCVEYETPKYDVTSIGFLVREGVEVEIIGNIYDNPELIGGAENDN